MKIIECPRDAMQGISEFIPTEQKVRYINQLLKVGFDTLDCGSFVSPKAIPQMRDTGDVIRALDWEQSKSKLLVIVANKRGAEDALKFDAVSFLGYPMSISETFQRRNTNKSIIEALNDLEQIIELTHSAHKQVVTYISMGFGNPYGDPYDVDIVIKFAELLKSIGSDVISLADTVGASTAPQITSLFSEVSSRLGNIEVGVHLHSTPQSSREKIRACFDANCGRIDGALKGFGGCPMAKDELVGNISTEQIIAFLIDQNIQTGINEAELNKALGMTAEIFPNH
ncbi:MAG TPA: hydroxymethylglutaryl-CoA lyase [Cyclobacteriaceae bacterium]|nr:hydroxymethylglutaryl-CoA lyase [Cyclobacteriaceae bacterium]